MASVSNSVMFCFNVLIATGANLGAFGIEGNLQMSIVHLLSTMDTLFRAIALLSLPALAVSAEPLKVVCFGDSTTAPREGVITYCDSLQREYSPGSRATVHNRGVPGNTTVMARARFQKDVLDEKPDLVFILFGINDSAIDVWKNPPSHNPRVSLNDYRSNLRYF